MARFSPKFINEWLEIKREGGLKLLFKKKVEQKDLQNEIQPEAYRDFMDYDGMGNQGRFPEIGKKK